MSTRVFQERGDLFVCSAEMKNEGVVIALKNEAQVWTTAAFREGARAPQADPGVKMGLTIRSGRRLHRREHRCPSRGGDAFKKAWGGH